MSLKKYLDQFVFGPVISGAIVSLLGLVGLLLLSFFTDGSLIRAMGGMTSASDPQNFSTANPNEFEVPQSRKAKFCALTSVKITQVGAQCYVRRNGEIWVYFNTEGANCSTACIF